MNRLDQIENRIKDIIEKGSDFFTWPDQEAVLIDHFCEALRQYLHDRPDCLEDSPAEFRVILSPSEFQLWKQQPDIEKSIQKAFYETTIELNCKPTLIPTIILQSRNSLQDAQISFSIDEIPEQEKTGAVNISKPHSLVKQVPTSGTARLLVDFQKEVPITKTIFNIGRKSNNDMVISDMRVSRQHAQLRKTSEGFLIFDVGSTGGTFINGERITSKILKSGDVIGLAGFSMVFMHESLSEPEDEREITSDLKSNDQTD